MKILKKLTAWIAWILIIGGLGYMLYTYLINKSALIIMLNDPAFKTAMGILQKMLFGGLAVLAGLIFLVVSLRLAISVRKKEKQKKKEAEEAENTENTEE